MPRYEKYNRGWEDTANNEEWEGTTNEDFVPFSKSFIEPAVLKIMLEQEKKRRLDSCPPGCLVVFWPEACVRRSAHEQEGK